MQWLYQDDPHQIPSHRLSQPSSDSSQPAISNTIDLSQMSPSNIGSNEHLTMKTVKLKFSDLDNSLTLKEENQNHDSVWNSDLIFKQLILFLPNLIFISLQYQFQCTSEFVKYTLLSVICLSLFSMFGNVVRHSLLCLWYSSHNNRLYTVLFIPVLHLLLSNGVLQLPWDW